jgi:formate dehydrogenase maturation protein FdhE
MVITETKIYHLQFWYVLCKHGSLIKKPTEMKTLRLKSPLLTAFLSFLFVSAVQFSFAQQTPTNTDQKDVRTATASDDSKDKMQKDYNKRMSQFNEMYTHVKNRAANSTDPLMKADMESLQSKMERIRADMASYRDKRGSMSEDEMDRMKTNLKAQLSSLKQDYKRMKKKYGKPEAGMDNDNNNNMNNNNQTPPNK